MLNMILPMVIAIIGYFLSHIGSSAQIRFFTIIGGVLVFCAALWFIYNAGYNIGYMLA